MLDAVVAAADGVTRAIEAEPDVWLTDVDAGRAVSGTLEGSGSIDVTGWRGSSEYAAGGQYKSYGEKLFLDLDGYTTAGLSLSGSVVVTRHSLDYGTNGKVEDASRSTRYVGSVVASGAVSGNFVVDVHANASGTTLWSCGVINDEETGAGRCF